MRAGGEGEGGVAGTGRCVRCAKHRAVCERDPEKPKQRACMKCASLKEKCEWLEVAGLGPVVDKGKGKAKEKEVVTSPRGGEKQKKKTTAKVVIDDDKIVEVAGLSGSRSSFNTGPFLEWMDRLTATVEAMTGQMAQIADSMRSVSQSNDRLSTSLKTFFKECRFFTSEFTMSEEESEEEVDLEEIDQELEGLQRDLEEQEGPALE